MNEKEMNIKSLKISLSDIESSQKEVDKNIKAWLIRSRELKAKYIKIEKQIEELEEPLIKKSCHNCSKERWCNYPSACYFPDLKLWKAE